MIPSAWLNIGKKLLEYSKHCHILWSPLIKMDLISTSRFPRTPTKALKKLLSLHTSWKLRKKNNADAKTDINIRLTEILERYTDNLERKRTLSRWGSKPNLWVCTYSPTASGRRKSMQKNQLWTRLRNSPIWGRIDCRLGFNSSALAMIPRALHDWTIWIRGLMCLRMYSLSIVISHTDYALQRHCGYRTLERKCLEDAPRIHQRKFRRW